MSLLDFLAGTPFSEALGWTLVHSLWEGILIAAALGALLVLVRSPRVRYAAACAALLLMLAGLAVTFLYFLPAAHDHARTSLKPLPAPWRELPSLMENSSRLPALAALIPWLTPLWLAGVCLFYLRYAAGWLSLYRLRRRGVCSAPNSWQQAVTRLALELKISRPVVLLESLLADTPVVLGHFRPVILTPLGFLTGLPPDQVEAILLHELAHISRSDYCFNVCQRLIEGLLFYHPAAWWISRVIRAERENCCDDMVVARSGDAHAYALALTSLEQNRLQQHQLQQQWSMSEPAVAATGGSLMKRIKRLLYPQGPSGIWAPSIAALVLIASTATMWAAWRVNPNDAWQKWLNEDVVYIISDQEKTAFENLKTGSERQHFIEQFWLRRDPTPDTAKNEFKEEHYRRIAYADSHFTHAPENLPGWRTDRGRIYILYGPPDEIDSHPHGGSYLQSASEGGKRVNTYAFEDWRYLRFQNVGNIVIEYVDPTMSGDFHMTLDPNEKVKKP